MGGLVDYGISATTKPSPRTVAIHKAQEDLRKEYDVRQERSRELEFLEKGGNPLDFKFGHVVESISVQSTSLTDQIAERNVISASKSSSVFAASPHGDSVESSGQLESSLCRETNTSDNLMLFSGDTNNIVKEKIVKRGFRRTNPGQLRQSSDGHLYSKNPEDSALSRPGVKNQAYARRNRSKSCRESANVASFTSHIPAKGAESKDAKGVIKKKKADELGALSGSSLKQGRPKCENAPKNPASNDHVVVELHGTENIHESHCIVKGKARQSGNNVKSTERRSTNVNDNQQADGCGDIAAACALEKKTDATLEEVVLRPSYSSAPTEYDVDDDHVDKDIVRVGELDNSSIIPACAAQAATLHKNDMDTCENTASVIDNHTDTIAFVAIDGKSDKDLDISTFSSEGGKEGGQLEHFIRPNCVEQHSNSAQPEISTNVHVNDAISPSRSMNNKGSSALEGINSCHRDTDSVHPIVAGSVLNALPDSMPSSRTCGSILDGEIKISAENLNKMANKEYEDSILRKAHLIKVGLKGACERSLCNISLEKRRKGHWDFVLDEMAWMANDFMQERLWRIMAASQVCHWIASDGLAKFDQASIQRKQKTIMRSLTKGVMVFWRSAETILTTGGKTKVIQEYNSNMPGEAKPTELKDEKRHGNESMETSVHPRLSQIQNYAVRFLKYNSHTSDSVVLAEPPPTPDRLNGFGILKMSDQLSQESFFYTLPPGAMLAYRESMESLFIYHKKLGNTAFKYHNGASMCDSAANLSQGNTHEEDEGETSTYLLPEAYNASLLSKMGHKRKNIMHRRINGSRPDERSTDVPYEPNLESKSGNQQLFLNGKRLSSSFLATPIKGVRTSTRQRFVSPFPASVGGIPQATCQTDVSSGDTNSYQDDRSSLQSRSLPWKNMEYESTADFDKQLPYDGGEVWTRPNKKKKHKNRGCRTAQTAANSRSLAVKGRIYDKRSQVDSIAQYEQKDFLKKKPDTGHFYSNRTTVANGGQHASKKLKIMKQGIDVSQDSPIGSQMSKMTNPAKIIKIFTNEDRRRKVEALKMSSGGGWSNFEDQALVILVHDMGENWELISDAINNIVQFKTVHRQPKECKERHKLLEDKSSGDGADSAEDPGSSQHYDLTGIPKGSARQFFQWIQVPYEEHNLKSHFEKIMVLMPQVQSRRRKVNNRELKPVIQPHSSHLVAFSEASPDNLPGTLLTPLDLCDTISLNPYHHGSIGPATPTPSNPNSRLPGSPGMVLGNNLPSPSTLSVPSRIDRGARMMPGVHGVGMMTGVNRGIPGARVGFLRVSSLGMLNMISRNMLPNSGQGMQNALNFHSRATSASGNPILRPRGPMQMLPPGQHKEDPKQSPKPQLSAQNPPVDAHPDSASTLSTNQVSDRDPMQHGQGSSPGNKVAISSVPQLGNQHKLYTSPSPQSPVQSPDCSNQGLMQGSTGHILLALQQPPLFCKSPLTTQQRRINPSHTSIQRMMTQQNLPMNSDCRTVPEIDQVQHNQMIPAIPTSHSVESGSPETSLTSSRQDVLQRKISGGLPMHGQDVGGQWHQQQSPQHLQSAHKQPQHPQRQVVPGSTNSPDSGSG